MNSRIPVWSRVVFAVLLPFVAYAVWDYVESRRLQSRLEAIQQSGQPLAPQPGHLPAEMLQAERFYRAAAALVNLPSGADRPIAETNRVLVAWRTSRWTPDAVALARSDVDANKEALQFVDRAADLPFRSFAPGTSYNYQTSDLIRLSRLLEYRSAIALDDHKPEAALASLYAEARLVRALEAVPTAVGVALARFRGLSAAVTASPRSGARASLARAFADLDRDDRLKQVLIAGRAMLLRGGVPAFVGPSQRTANPFAAHILTSQLDAFADLIAAADAPWPQRIDRRNAVDRWPYGFGN